mmetsp:Transcript_131843/g.328748  ORF Transcript_131843/g.328748 Transcript_131843/m.328748 type:complete len:363 (-) Transcript_131843:955-2043(-)
MATLNFLHRYEGLHYQCLQLQCLPQVTDHGEHVLTLSLVEVLNIDYLLLRLLVLVPQFLQLLCQLLHLILLGSEIGFQLCVLLPLQFLLPFDFCLFLLLLSEPSLLLLQLSLLLDCFLHDLFANNHFLFHLSQLGLQLSLPLRFHLGLSLLSLDVLVEPAPFAFCKLLLRCNRCLLLLSLPPVDFILSAQLILQGFLLLLRGTLNYDLLALNNFFDNLFFIFHLLLDARGQRCRRRNHLLTLIYFAATHFTPPIVELCLEPHDFLLKLTNHCILGILVDARLVLNTFGTVGIPQCGQCLVIVVVGWAEIGNHDGLCVTTQRILQQASELRVTVRDVRGFPINESRDHIPQSGERQVDLRSLF